jgi:hypothetical protein
MRKLKKPLCLLTSLLLVLSLASGALSWPLPPRTIVDIPQQGESLTRATPICGAVANFAFDVTTDAATTDVIPLGGMIPWRVVNESGASATLTFYDALTVDGTALSPYDQDGVAVAAVTVGDDCSYELPSGLAGCTCLVIKGGSAADGFTLVCRR